jgi:hypothetical protein
VEDTATGGLYEEEAAARSRFFDEASSGQRAGVTIPDAAGPDARTGGPCRAGQAARDVTEVGAARKLTERGAQGAKTNLRRSATCALRPVPRPTQPSDGFAPTHWCDRARGTGGAAGFRPDSPFSRR